MEGDRRRAVSDFSRDLAVDASAGTGKTATLVARVTNLFLAKKELGPDDVLLLTFTDKAAAEMKSRISEGWELLLSACRSASSVEEAAAQVRAWNPLVEISPDGFPSTDDLTARASGMTDGVGRLSVTTFHSFCRRLLLSHPAEAGVDPRFEVLPEGAAADAWDAAFRRFLRAEFGRPEADPRWEPAVARAADRTRAFGMVRRMCLYHRDVLEERGLDFGSPADLLGYLTGEYAETVRWFRAFEGGIADRSHAMAQTVEAARAALDRVWDAVERGDLAAAAGLAAEGVRALGFRADRLRSQKTYPRPPGETPAGARDRLLVLFRVLAEAPRGDAAARFLVDRARVAARFYDEAKGGGLDFMDLLLRACALLRENPQVARKVSERFRHVLVDEFQDTDPLQADMLRVLAGVGPPGRLFLVGDPKQSIYGFRRADVRVYHRFREELIARSGGAIRLVTNFRSRPDLVAAVNGLFASVLPGDEEFAPYAPVVPFRGDPCGAEAATFFSLGEGVEEARFLAGLIERIVGETMVGDKGGGPERPAQLRDIAVLYRSDTGGGILASYRDALTDAGIPCLVPSRRGFFARQEVQDLRMVLAAVDAPADGCARYAALKTIFFGLSDREIVPLHCGGEGAVSARARDALGLLARLSASRGKASLPALIEDLYRESGVEFVAARLPEGERIVQNLAKAAEIAFAFEWRGGGSLKAFIREIRRKTDEERPETEFPTFEEGEDAVRISTIHLSKGLEFPVVILANLSRGGRRPPEGLRVDRIRNAQAVIFPGFRTYSAYRLVPAAGNEPVTFEQWEARRQDAEERRLLYVAATRARDRLFFVESAKGRGSVAAEALRAALALGGDGGPGVCTITGLPGTRRTFPSGGSVLEVAVREPLPLPGAPSPPAPAPAPLPEWSPPPAPAAPPEAQEVTVKELYDRDVGTRFGDAVHRALEAAPPVGGPWPPARPLPVVWREGEETRWRRICRSMARSEMGRLLRGAALVGTELPMLSLRGGWSRQERADLVVRVPSGDKDGAEEYWIVDYKTGPREGPEEREYEGQVRGYMEVLSGAWGVPVRGFLWYVETGESVEIERPPPT